MLDVEENEVSVSLQNRNLFELNASSGSDIGTNVMVEYNERQNFHYYYITLLQHTSE